MDVEQFGLGVALDQRVAPQQLDGPVELQRISRHRREQRPEVCCSFGHNRFRNDIRVQEGAQAQQVGCGRTLLFHLRKGERPGAGHRVRIVGRHAALLLEQRQPALRIELEVLRQATARLLHVGSRLIEGQRQAIQFLYQLLRCLAYGC